MASGRDNIVGDYYALHRIVGNITAKLGGGIESILWKRMEQTPTGYLIRAYSDVASKTVYYAPRNPDDGFPPRQNTLKGSFNYNHRIRGTNDRVRGFNLHSDTSIKHRGHKSLFGKTKGQEVYPWVWISEGTTWKNRFSGNPRNFNQKFIGRWNAEYKPVYVSKLKNELRAKGWNVY